MESLVKRIIIICEGPTEQEFCRDVLIPYFSQISIYISHTLINKSGGIVSWHKLKNQIQHHLLNDGAVYVTTLIDYYGIHNHHHFPAWEAALRENDKYARLKILEDGMLADIDKRNNSHARFIPFLMLHEFEGLLFNNLQVFENQIPREDFLAFNELKQTLLQYPNPELINDTPNNAPSYRLKRLIKGYNKIVYGAILAKEIGLTRIRNKCRKFDSWMNTIEALSPQN